MAALIRHLAETPAFEGIGWAKAARLAEVFGPDLPRLLAGGDPNPLATVVGEREAETLVRAWAEDLARGDVVVWLEERGFDPRLAGKVMRLWGAEAAQRIRSQPYAMMALASWPTVDAAAKRIGTAEDDPARLIAAVEAVLYERLQSQHTWTSDATLRARLRKLLGPVGAVSDVSRGRPCPGRWGRREQRWRVAAGRRGYDGGLRCVPAPDRAVRARPRRPDRP
ncbi:helix-hairpin-helix domain-containing protein [Chenggangzhangella methanolivorans]|uniref:ATP-dependent RecD2 DNA helicase-like helix-hairpin-helix domain-containing protein n=1 Tax=Chenggangzhangella methanolivorans TaxID=1437009 RepID=A0A9E6R9A6_9HYPH|nr:helix-hairpin-helix domain-containing protein [Chenggangzhangella methanolivorans]QZO00145.1 hypothetical protein K6K41_26990 [Chenggangzhangella methanolivorans]